MSYARRMKKVSHDGVLNVFDLDDELEELNISTDNEVKDKGIINSKVKQRSKSTYVDPLSNRNYVDPLSKRSVKDVECTNSKSSEMENKTKTDDKDKTGSQTNRTQSLQTTNKVEITQKGQQPTQNVTQKPQTTQRNPTFSSNNINRNRVTPRVNKDQKGFGHEERDMFVDDIEEF
ncbi:hypothetical protein ACF0H5_020855 [Mactra antiquata]